MSKDNKTFVKLRDAGTIFFDMPNQLKVAGDQIVEVSKEGKVAEAISAGILVEVSEEDAKKAQATTADAKGKITADQKADTVKLQEAHNAEIADLTTKHETQVTDLTNTYNTNVEELKNSHKTEVDGLNEAHNAEMQKLKDENTKLKEEVAELKEAAKKASGASVKK